MKKYKIVKKNARFFVYKRCCLLFWKAQNTRHIWDDELGDFYFIEHIAFKTKDEAYNWIQKMKKETTYVT